MISCKLTGSLLDYSGVGDSNRADLMSLFSVGVNLSTEIVIQVPEQIDHSIPGEIARRLEGRKIPHKIKILHITPDLIPKYKEQGVYHIARCAWETSKLPSVWVAGLNECDEIWTMCASTEKAMKESGVVKPIFVFPEAIDTTKAEELTVPYEVEPTKSFYFYSMFQWIERKNPRALLRAYWKAFEGNRDVALLLKTYRVTYQDQEFDQIRAEIQKWKEELNLSHYPEIYLIRRLLTADERWRLHRLADCYITASSGEGWGRPLQEMMLLGKPVISPSSGGITDMIDSYHYYEVPSTPMNATPQSHIPWYQADQEWKVIDEHKLSQTMLKVYNGQGVAEEKAQKAKQIILDQFSYQTVGQQMLERLEHINDLL